MSVYTCYTYLSVLLSVSRHDEPGRVRLWFSVRPVDVVLFWSLLLNVNISAHRARFSDTSRAFHVVFCWLTALTLISHSWLHQSAKTEQTVVPTRLISQEPGPKLQVLQRLRLQIKNPTQTLKVRKFILREGHKSEGSEPGLIFKYVSLYFISFSSEIEF